MLKLDVGSLLLLLLLAGSMAATPGPPINLYIPISYGSYKELQCGHVQESQVTDVFKANAYNYTGKFFDLRVNNDHTKTIRTFIKYVTDEVVGVNVTIGQRYYYFQVDDNVSRCRNVKGEKYGAVCVWVSDMRTVPGPGQGQPSAVHACIAIAVKRITLDMKGYDFGCFTATNSSISYRPGPSHLPEFLRGAARGYHRAMCSHNTASPLPASASLLLLLCLCTLHRVLIHT